MYGHQYLVREEVARVLGDMMDESIIDGDDAREIAQAVMHDNLLRVFGVQDAGST